MKFNRRISQFMRKFSYSDLFRITSILSCINRTKAYIRPDVIKIVAY